jgi:hypothetical protein
MAYFFQIIFAKVFPIIFDTTQIYDYN